MKMNYEPSWLRYLNEREQFELVGAIEFHKKAKDSPGSEWGPVEFGPGLGGPPVPEEISEIDFKSSAQMVEECEQVMARLHGVAKRRQALAGLN